MSKSKERLVNDSLKVTMSYVNCSAEEDFYSIEILDSNRKIVAIVRLDLSDFAKMVGSRGDVRSRPDSLVVKVDD